MVKLPSNLQAYHKEATLAMTQGLVKEIEFSGATYQVLVEDIHTHANCWVFLQLEGRGQIKDTFCSCDEANDWEGTSPCLHVAVAYLSLYNQHSLPLHQRFVRSLWNQLCQLYAERVGDDVSSLTSVEPGRYTYQTSLEKQIFVMKGKTPEAIQRLENLLAKQPKETEETSLKFSNLSQEELLQWQAGKPSPQLRYHLSFWSEIAKWMMHLQEEDKSYDISFKYSKRNIPNWIQIDFTDWEIGFYLPESKLPLIIPSLATVKSPLIVQYSDHQEIGRITYDPKESCLIIEGNTYKAAIKKKWSQKQHAEAINLDGWTYISKEGFFAEEPHILLQNPILAGEELSHALTEYGPLLSKFLSEYAVHLEPIPVSYKLFFDEEWSLHILCYIFEPGDLNRGDSCLIDEWAFLDEDGFYHLKDKRFDEIETVIPVHQVSDFITQNRVWIGAQTGFQTHIRSIEYQLSYSVSANSRLSFSRTVAKNKENSKLQDFGSWIYLEDYGFYPKSISSYGLHVKPGLSLSAEQVPLFIKMNRDELALIPGFFSTICPITKMGLKIDLTSQGNIQVIPEYEVLPDYRQKTVRLFDECVYVEDEGFFELPLELRLPEKFRHFIELKGAERDLFLQFELEDIQKYVFSIAPELIKPKKIHLVTSFAATAKEKGRGWYLFNLNYQTERGLVSVITLWEAVKKKQAFAYHEAGLINLKDKRYDWIRQLKKERIDASDQTTLLTVLEFMRLNAFDPIDFLDVPGTDSSESQHLLKELTQLQTPDKPDMGGLLSHLRPYQEIGVHWLWFLYHQQLSGLLCDDMGLGKTHQAMGLLSSIHNLYQSYAEGMQKHFLVVCPTSVIYHWQEKLQEFLPGLKVYTFYGAGRSLDEFREHYDILLTSYGILRNESEVVSKIPFEVAIFDEIQIAKNQASRVYAALTKIKARMKLGLTGTPIENYLRELKSLFDIVLPSYMPGDVEYREFFVRPIEKEHNPHRKDILNRLIKPFIMRRKKEEVLTDLPEKIEEIAHCDLLSYQRQLYSEVLEQRRRHLLEELESSGAPIPYLHIFALLSSLKQICDHPAVYLKKPEDYQQYLSGKWELFLELLREARESNQKVVVFSQYLGMLDIIQSHLQENGIGFASLRGATTDRKEQIQRFNQVPECEVFVGSLQAAGLGVDLTAGSVVIHYDRWWNAARENQATDRVHRIGQKRGVQVFKLVTKNTFEEKIDLLIQRKGQLMEDIIGVDDHNTIKRFTREDLVDLLSFTGGGGDEEHPSISDVD